MLLHYLGKLQIRNFALFMHVKHVSNVTFPFFSFLSSIQQISVKWHKISAKINTMQNINIFSFCSFTVLNRLKALQLSKVGLWSDLWPDIIDTAVAKWRKHLQACVRANDGHFEHLLWTNLQTIFNFSCLFGLSGFCPSCQIFTVLTLDGW